MLTHSVAFTCTLPSSGSPDAHPACNSQSAIIDALRNKEAVDDRKLLLEQALTILSRLPVEGATSKKLCAAIIGMCTSPESQLSPNC